LVIGLISLKAYDNQKYYAKLSKARYSKIINKAKKFACQNNYTEARKCLSKVNLKHSDTQFGKNIYALYTITNCISEYNKYKSIIAAHMYEYNYVDGGTISDIVHVLETLRKTFDSCTKYQDKNIESQITKYRNTFLGELRLLNTDSSNIKRINSKLEEDPLYWESLSDLYVKNLKKIIKPTPQQLKVLQQKALEKKRKEEKSKQQQYIENHPLELVKCDSGHDDLGSVYITGLVRNNTDKDYSYVQILFDIKDKYGSKIDDALANTSGLRAHQTWTFKAYILNPENSKSYRLNKLEGY
jgi:hypothetical protein